MADRITFRVIDPNGVPHTRSSTRFVYRFAVLGRASFDRLMEVLTGHQATINHYLHYQWCMRIVDGGGVLGGRSDYHTDEYVARQLANANAVLASAPNASTYRDMRLVEARKSAEDLRDEGAFDKFFAISWSGRRDFADRRACRAMSRFDGVIVSPVTAE